MLVTGSKGFIGKNLSNHLGQIEQNVQLIDADYFQDEDWKRSLFNFLEKCNPKAVFHVGACSNTLEVDVQLMMEQNYESTKIISNSLVNLDTALKVLLISSSIKSSSL